MYSRTIPQRPLFHKRYHHVKTHQCTVQMPHMGPRLAPQCWRHLSSLRSPDWGHSRNWAEPDLHCPMSAPGTTGAGPHHSLYPVAPLVDGAQDSAPCTHVTEAPGARARQRQDPVSFPLNPSPISVLVIETSIKIQVTTNILSRETICVPWWWNIKKSVSELFPTMCSEISFLELFCKKFQWNRLCIFLGTAHGTGKAGACKQEQQIFATVDIENVSLVSRCYNVTLCGQARVWSEHYITSGAEDNKHWEPWLVRSEPPDIERALNMSGACR